MCKYCCASAGFFTGAKVKQNQKSKRFSKKLCVDCREVSELFDVWGSDGSFDCIRDAWPKSDKDGNFDDEGREVIGRKMSPKPRVDPG